MNKQTLGTKIASFRKSQGITQLELAEQLGVTDKAVSKWERDLSCPDVNTIPKLAEVFGISVEELMQGNAPINKRSTADTLIDIILKGVALAMGIAVSVLSILEQVDVPSAIAMLGIGLSCLAVSAFPKKDK